MRAAVTSMNLQKWKILHNKIIKYGKLMKITKMYFVLFVVQNNPK